MFFVHFSLKKKCWNVFSSCHQLSYALRHLDPGAFHLLPPPARKFPQKTLTNPCPSGNIYRQSVRLRIEYGRVPEWPMGTDCKSAAFSFGGSNPPAPTKKTSVENTLVFCFIRYLKFHSQGWIRTAAATSLKTAQKQPSATATTAASGRSREELFGLRPAGCACRPRHDAAAGSRDPGSFLFCAARDIHPRPPRNST